MVWAGTLTQVHTSKGKYENTAAPLSPRSVLMLLFSSSASALVTLAAVSCGDWIKHKGSDGRTLQSYRFWLLGYVSRMAVSSNLDVLRDVDNTSIELWMDNYCTMNPLKHVDGGGVILFRELEQKTKRK